MHTFEQRNEMRHYRRVFAEMPIGDPTSGAAYGEYLKSKGIGMVIGIVSAVAAVATGGASLAAMSASGAWSVGSALSAGAMVAGGVMSGVGAVTGNKKLMKIGGVLSLAGGIGTMMTGGIGGAGAAAETGTANAAPVTAEATSTAGDTLNSAIGDSLTTSAEAAKASSTAIPKELAVDAVPGASSGSTSTGYDLGSGLAAPKQSLAPTTANAPTDLGSGLQSAGGTNTIAPVDAAASATGGGGGSGGGILADAYNKAGDIASGAGKFFKDNKEMVEIGGKMLMGATDPERDLTGAKQALLDAQTTAQSATANATNQQASSLQQKRELEAQQAKNANTQILMLDPRDPQYAAKKAEAAAKGIPTMDYNVPGQTGPILGGNMQWSSNTQTPNVAPQQLQRLQR